MTFKYIKKQLPGDLTFGKRTGLLSHIDFFDMGISKHPKAPEEFVRGLIAFYESNDDFKIIPVGESPKIIHHTLFGCRTNDTKEWKALLELLQNKGIFSIENEARRKILTRLNKKFVILFRNQLSVHIPPHYKLKVYEKLEKKKYKFIFTVLDKSLGKFYLACEKLSREDLKQSIRDIAKRFYKGDEQDINKFEIAYDECVKRGWDPDGSFKDEIWEVCGPQIEIGEEKIDPHDESIKIRTTLI